MKAGELIERLKGYEDFDLELDIVTQPRIGTNPKWIPYTIEGINQIDELNNCIQLDVQRR